MIEIFTHNLDKIEGDGRELPTYQRHWFRLAILALRVFIYFVERYNNENKTET